MLEITIFGSEQWNEETEEFVTTEKDVTLQLEHSLVSISKWESKWNKSFISTKDKTYEETIDYIRCMTLNKHVDPEVYKRLTVSNINEINKYIEAPMTATWFSEDKNTKANREIVTSELIYYWMVAYQIPFECQKWHLNRLITLVKVCSIKNQTDKKMSKREILSKNAALNEARKRKLNTKG